MGASSWPGPCSLGALPNGVRGRVSRAQPGPLRLGCAAEPEQGREARARGGRPGSGWDGRPGTHTTRPHRRGGLGARARAERPRRRRSGAQERQKGGRREGGRGARFSGRANDECRPKRRPYHLPSCRTRAVASRARVYDVPDLRPRRASVRGNRQDGGPRMKPQQRLARGEVRSPPGRRTKPELRRGGISISDR